MRNNMVRDLTAMLMSKVCHNVCIEPALQPITGEALSGTSDITEDSARLYVASSSICGGRFKPAFFDVRVFNPHAQSNRQLFSPATENTRNSAYEQGVQEIEHGSFTHYPHHVSHWRSGKCCYKRLASLLLPNRICPTTVPLPGLDAACLFHFYACQSNASEVLTSKQPTDLVSTAAKISRSL